MAKTKISEWDSNPNNNTDIDSINIAEGCAPSGINNAIRELMSQVKDLYAGTSGDTLAVAGGGTGAGTAAGARTNLGLGSMATQADTSVDINGGNIDGTAIGASSASTGAFTTLSASGAVTLSGATANGVMYANGSKVVTTGSGFVTDGTNVSLGTSSVPAYSSRLAVQSASATDGVVATFANTGSTGARIQFFQDGVDTALIGMPAGSGGIAFSLSGSEQMRLTSTGLGIGTSSPGYKLEVNGSGYFSGNVNIANTGAVQSKDTSGTLYNMLYMYSDNNVYLSSPVASSSLIFRCAGYAERMRLDSSGNLGLGVTPSAWDGGGVFRALQLGGAVYNAISSSNSYLLSSANAVYSGAAFKYISSAAASSYTQNGGAHYWNVAPSGTAGNAISFTQAMTLDASGNLLVGTTSQYGTARLTVGVIPGTNNGLSTFPSSNTNYNAFIFLNGANSQIGSISCTTAATAYNTSSDYRLKENIQPMTGALERNALLKPCTYSWVADGSSGEGFIAHELQSVFSNAVTGEKDAVDANGNPVYQGVDTSFLVGHLVACIQELKAELDALKAKIG